MVGVYQERIEGGIGLGGNDSNRYSGVRGYRRSSSSWGGNASIFKDMPRKPKTIEEEKTDDRAAGGGKETRESGGG